MNKLLIFAAVYHPYKGGYTESMHELAKRLAQKGWAVTVLACNTHRRAEQEIIDGIEVKRIPCVNPKWLNSTFPIPLPFPKTFRILKIALSPIPDLISTQTRFFPTAWLGFFIGKIKNIPIAHTERGAIHSIVSSRLISWISAIIDHTLGWIIVRFSNMVIGVSDASCQFLRHLGAKNPLKIYNGVDTVFWQNPSVISHGSSVISQLSITFVGRLIYSKGVQDLLHAVVQIKNVRKQEPKNIIVNIVGDGTYRPVLERFTHELKLDDNIRFLGEMTKEQVREILWQTDIFVNPSHSEGLPRSVLEAAAAGLPIIATDVGGTNEIIPDDSYGLLIPSKNPNALAEKLAALTNDENLRTHLGGNAQRYVKEHFDWDKITEQYIEVMEQLTGDN